MRRLHLSRRAAPVLVAAVVLTACGDGAADTAADTATTDATADEAPSDATGEDGMAEGEHDGPADDGDAATGSSDEGDAAADGDAASGLGALGDVTATRADGSSVTLAELAGEQVFVETFATWCSNCRRQLGDTQQAAAEAGDAARFLALSVESDLDPAALEGYAAENGFEAIEFAVLDDASLALLQDAFGGAVLVPPSTPKFRVDADGSVSELSTGFESPEEILAQLAA